LLQRFYQRESRLLRRRRVAVSVSEFQVLSCVGRGAFGEVRIHETGGEVHRLGVLSLALLFLVATCRRQVFLAVKRDTNEVAAIKRIRKSILAEPDKVDKTTNRVAPLTGTDSVSAHFAESVLPIRPRTPTWNARC